MYKAPPPPSTSRLFNLCRGCALPPHTQKIRLLLTRTVGIDLQGLLNKAYQEDVPTDVGVDHNKKGDEQAGQHIVSLSHSGSGSGVESGKPAAENSNMEVEPPSYRNVDIVPPMSQSAELQAPAIPAPTQGGSADPAMAPSPATSPAMNLALDSAHTHNFAVPAEPKQLDSRTFQE